jgi:mRNA interferase RelE/StbE
LAWIVDFDPRALKELEKLDRPAQRRIVKFLQERLSGHANPRYLGKSLSGEKAGLWRYRVGEYRLICGINDQAATVRVLRVAHRKDVYR